MPDESIFDTPEPVEAPVDEPVEAKAPVGAAVVSHDEELTPEAVVAAANTPGDNLVAETVDEVVEVEAETVKVQIAEDSPVDEVYVEVPGIDAEADYATVESHEVELYDGGTEEREVARVKVTSSPVELPLAVGELVAATPFVEVAE